MNFSKEKLDNAINSVPEVLKDALFSAETSDKMEKILNRHNATDQAMDVSAVIGYTLAGLIPVKKFITELKNTAGLDESTAKNIAHDVRSQILAPVAQELAALQEQAEKNYDAAVANSSQQAAAPTAQPKPAPVSAPASPQPADKPASPPKAAAPSSTPIPQTKPGLSNPPATPTEPKSPSEPTPPPQPAAPAQSNNNASPQIEYLKYKNPSTDLEKPDESVAREHPNTLSEQKTQPENTPLAPAAPRTPTQPSSDTDLKDEIFPPPPSIQETKTPPPPNLPGTGDKKEKKDYPPIPDSHKVDLKSNSK